MGTSEADRYGPALTHDDLNRALLARQHLLAPRPASVLDEVDHLVGLQSQVPQSPYPGLWSRLGGFAAEHLGDRLLDRTVGRVSTLRGTIHLSTADDALELPDILRPLYEKDLRSNTQHSAALGPVDHQELAKAATDALADGPLAPLELGTRLAERWDVEPAHLAYGARSLLPLVQATPRGLWGAGGTDSTTRWTTADVWFGRPAVRLEDPDARTAALVRLVKRYLAAFGPATVLDAQRWSGLTGLRAAVEQLRPDLLTFTGPDGKEYFDAPDAPRPSGSTPVPLALVADFDNLVLGHADRTRIIADARRKRIITINGQIYATVLVDGYVVATWKVRREGKAPDAVAHLDVRELDFTFTRQQLRALEERGEELLRFVAPEAADHRVVVAAS